MKRILCMLLLAFVSKFSFGQKPSIVGAWYWADSVKQVSMFFKQDGGVSMQSGSKGSVMLSKNLKNGTYVLSAKLLIIKWADNSLEKDKIEFAGENSFILTLSDKTKLIFKRVVDEEVVEVK